MLDGWRHADPPTQKKLPVESDVPKYLVNKAGHKAATALDQAIADLTTIAFYYLLCVGGIYIQKKQKRNKAYGAIQNGRCHIFQKGQQRTFTTYVHIGWKT